MMGAFIFWSVSVFIAFVLGVGYADKIKDVLKQVW
jgi:hypothetical protein